MVKVISHTFICSSIFIVQILTIKCEARVSHSCAMGHKHEWCNEPPIVPTIYFNKSFDERYGDEEDEASNSFLTSPEELQRLRLLLEKNPDFEASSSWPQLVEWCSSCTQTRMV